MSSATSQPSEAHREVGLERLDRGRYRVRNARGGEMTIGHGEDADFTPVELLLAAIAGCSAIDVDFIVSKRAEAERFVVTSSGEKAKDAGGGNLMSELTVDFDLAFADDEAGRAADEVVDRSIRQAHDRLCTVSRTVTEGAPVTMRRR